MRRVFNEALSKMHAIRESLEKQFSGDTERFESIIIQGSQEFVDYTKSALTLLSGTSSYHAIAPYLSKIREAERSGMRAYDAVPTFEVKPDWQQSAVWYASIIAHDGYHSLLYHEAKDRNNGKEPKPDEWIGVEAERRCLEFQINALTELNADQSLIDDLEALKANPTYQGDGSWEDYYKRDW